MPPATFPDEQLLKQALKWFFLLQSENCTDKDRQKFNRWLCQSEAHQAAYTYAQRLWLETDGLKEAPDIPGLHAARQRRSKHQPAGILGWALFFLISSALMSIGWLEYSAETVMYSTRLGEQRLILLADGSRINMNTATRLQVRISYLQRTITLDTGEAVFDVAHEVWRPFIVHVGTLQIRDIGTRFNVDKRQGDVSVTVLEGAVEIGGTRLNEGYQRHYFPGSDHVILRPVDTEQIAAWQHGRLIFRQTPLATVAAELERYHPVRFIFTDPAVAHETLSGTFGVRDLPLFLSSLEKALPVRVKRLPDGQTLLIDRVNKKM